MTLEEAIKHAEEDVDRCYECSGYGDDYCMDDNGDYIKACDDCPYNQDDAERREGEWI